MTRNDVNNGWVRRTILAGCTSNILDIQFAPHYLGLRLVFIYLKVTNFYFIY